MSDERVQITYEATVYDANGTVLHPAGEGPYVIADAATAAQVHPDATITSYADGRPFDAKSDASLVAAAEEAGAEAKTKKDAKAAAKNNEATTETTDGGSADTE